jgi:methyl-accepting chemotaxis protein
MRALKERIAALPLKKKIEASMGLKFVVALAAVISVIMVLGTIFVGRMLTESQYRDIEKRGRELGMFLGKAGADALLRKDIIALDGLAAEAANSQEVLYTYIVDDANKILNSAQASFNRSDPAVQALMAEEKNDDVALLAAKVKDKLDAIETQSDIMVGATRLGTIKMGFSRALVKKDAGNVVWLLLGTSAVIVVVLSTMIYFMTQRMIVRPTREAVSVASNTAGGDLTKSVRVRSVDELGMLGRGLNRMIIGLKGMIRSIWEAARNLDSVWGEVKEIAKKIISGSQVQAESVEEAASSVNEMHFSLKEIAANMEELHATSERTSSSVIEMAATINEVAKSVSELSGFIEETSAAIIQMSAAMRQIAEHVEMLSSAAEETSASSLEISASVKEVEETAKQSASLAEAVAADAQELGARSIEKTIEGMGRIESNARRTADVVNRLGERAESIGGILTVIEDITDQTGLLALNAAILAAQAGEHGKGFAVVAAEIRELANRTAASTQEIGKLITTVQGESREAVEAMKEGVVFVEEGVRLATGAGAALKKILERAGSSRDMSRSINMAAAEQTRGIKQVSEAVERINEMTHQIARATSEQKAGSEQIMQAAEKMRELTRFVKISTEEQAKAGKDITLAVENISTKIGMVNRATGEVQEGSDLIVKAIERIKEIAKANADLAVGLNKAMDVMATQSTLLGKAIEKFKMADAGPRSAAQGS